MRLAHVLTATFVATLPFSANAQESATEAEPTASAPTTQPGTVTSASDRLQDFDDLSIESLLNTEVTTATKSTAKKAVDSPAIMTVISHDEILRSGARDLVDLLLLVPGFQMGTDTFNSAYVGFRGLWGAEGRVLFMLNGQEMQELLYNTVPLGNRFPVDWIERIEIIRGPGSAVYGGTAELAVVNVVTHQPADFERVGVYGVYGEMLHGALHDDSSLKGTYGRRDLSLIAGHVFQGLDGLALGAAAFVGEGKRSDRTYTDLYGSSFDMAKASATSPGMVNVWGSWRGLKLNYLLEDYRLTLRDGYDVVLPVMAHADFKTSALDASYEWEVTPGVKITPRLRYVYEKPWQTTDTYYKDDISIYWDPIVQRTEGSLAASWDVLDNLNLAAGAIFTYDQAHDEVNGFADPNASTHTLHDISYDNFAAYAQGLWDTPWVNVSLGARFEDHSQFGTSFVPRVGLTRTFGAFHVKALASQAFRSPSISNLAATPNVVPERATIFELEAGGRLTDNLYVGINTFDTTAKKPIVYYYDATTNSEGYKNYDQLGSRGFELEARWKYLRHYVTVTYSYYDAAGKNEVDTFAVPGNKNVLLGFSPSKVTVNGAFELIDNLSLGASLIYLSGQRYAYTKADRLGTPLLEDLGAVTLVNVHVMYQNLLVPGLSLGLSGYNLLDENMSFAQPYNNGHAPLPAMPLELLLKLAYELPLK